MNIDQYLHIARVGIETALMVSAPVLLVGLIVGLVINIFQAATQISDPAIAFIPKIGASVCAIVVFGHFMINRLAWFTTWLYNSIGNVGAG